MARPRREGRRRSVDAAQGPVRRTRSVTISTVLGFSLGAIMTLWGLFVADTIIFAAGSVLMFGALIALVTVRFMALSANAQIKALESVRATGHNAAAKGRPATARHLATAKRMTRCPRCRHQQPWKAGANIVCEECGLSRVLAQH